MDFHIFNVLRATDRKFELRGSKTRENARCIVGQVPRRCLAQKQIRKRESS